MQKFFLDCNYCRFDWRQSLIQICYVRLAIVPYTAKLLRFIIVLLFCLFLLYPAPVFAVSIEASLALGLEKSQSGDYRGAVIEFNKVIAIDPDNASAYQYRGVAKAKYGDFEGSIVDYSKSIELNSNRTESYGSRGIAKARSGDVAAAILDFDVAIQLNPEDGSAYFNRAMAMDMVNDIQHACLDWKQAIKLGSKESKLFLRKYCG